MNIFIIIPIIKIKKWRLKENSVFFPVNAIATLLCGLQDTCIEQGNAISEHSVGFLFDCIELRCALHKLLSRNYPTVFNSVNPGQKLRTRVNNSKAVIVGVNHFIISPGLENVESDLAVALIPLAALGLAIVGMNTISEVLGVDYF